MLDSRASYVKNIIPQELWLKARAAALTEGKTIGVWIAGAIEDKLNTVKTKTVKEDKVTEAPPATCITTNKVRIAMPSDNY